MFKNSICIYICLLLSVAVANAQQTIEQNGMKTTVTPLLAAQGPNAYRYEVAQLGFNSFHWQSSGLVMIEIFTNSYSGGYDKYILDQGFITGFIPRLNLVESYGSQHLAKITLGTIYDLNSSHAGFINRALPIYLDVKQYTGVKLRLTYSQSLVTYVTDMDQITIHTNPIRTEIASFDVTTIPTRDLLTTGKLAIDGAGNHYIANGNLGIGTVNPQERLSVNGKIRAHEIKVESDPATWPDYVFRKDYELPSLQQTEDFIQKNGHLPGIPSAATVAKEGVALGEMNRKLLEKLEEVILHLIQKDQEVKKLEREVQLIKMKSNK